MTVAELKENIQSDLYRHNGAGFKQIARVYLTSRSFKITFWLRLAQFCVQNRIPLVGLLVRLQYRMICNRYCVDFPVRIAPGSKIVGGVEIGDRSVIGANAVVVKDVPPDAVAVGVPARVLDHPFNEFSERYFWPQR
jgi:serine acetyltransferase